MAVKIGCDGTVLHMRASVWMNDLLQPTTTWLLSLDESWRITLDVCQRYRTLRRRCSLKSLTDVQLASIFVNLIKYWCISCHVVAVFLIYRCCQLYPTFLKKSISTFNYIVLVKHVARKALNYFNTLNSVLRYPTLIGLFVYIFNSSSINCNINRSDYRWISVQNLQYQHLMNCVME